MGSQDSNGGSNVKHLDSPEETKEQHGSGAAREEEK